MGVGCGDLPHAFSHLNRWHHVILLLAAVAALSFVAAGPSLDNAVKAAMTGTRLFPLLLPGFLSNSVCAWSLGIEGMFYIVSPLAALVAAASSLRALVGTTAIMPAA